jgi:hypothetical protein
VSDQALKCPTCGALLDLSSYMCPGCGRDVASFAPTQEATAAPPLAEGAYSRIGEFRILRTIGRGGTGTVYEAYQESMHRRVALKVIDAATPLSSSGASRFEREAWIAGSLSHPNIVKVYGQGAVGTTRYIAMELVEGESLAAVIREAKADRTAHSASDSTLRSGHIQKTVSMFVDLADALQNVHERRIVHRDIKPSNLLLTKDKSRLLLSDFGLARDEKASQLTRRGDFMGTVRYMSPEQLLAQRVRVDHRTDIWSFGVSIYEALTLDLPYSGDSEEAYIGAVSMKEPTPARTRNRAVPRDLETVLMKCLERDPERRYASAAELKDDLARYLEGRTVLARRPGVVRKVARLAWRRRLAVGTAVITMILVLAIVGALAKRARHQADVERIRWTLQQVIDNPQTEPAGHQPDWSHLQDILHQEVRKNPRGDLALLAQRAACRVKVSAPSFGLLSKLPDMTVVYSFGVDPGKDFFNIIYVEGALDDGPWKPIGSASFRERDEATFIYSTGLGHVFPPADLTPTPHQVKLRATFRLFDANNKLSSEAKSGLLANAWPAVKNSVPLFTETRELDPLSINIFREYPKDFPREVFASQVTGTPQSWFHLDRIRIVRVKLPAGNAPCFTFEWPNDKRKESYCTPRNQAKLTNPVVGIELFGGLKPPILLAADTTVWSNRNSKALLSFPLVCCPSGQLLDPWRFATTGVRMAGSPFWSSSSELNFATTSNPLPVLPDDTEDGTTSGRIEFAPSRSVALATKALDRYFGEKVSIPVPSLEVVTVPGE